MAKNHAKEIEMEEEEEEEDLSIPPIFRCGIYNIVHHYPDTGRISVDCLYCPPNRLSGNIKDTSNFRQHLRRMHYDLLPKFEVVKEETKIKREKQRNQRRKEKAALAAKKKIFLHETPFLKSAAAEEKKEAGVAAAPVPTPPGPGGGGGGGVDEPPNVLPMHCPGCNISLRSDKIKIEGNNITITLVTNK